MWRRAQIQGLSYTCEGNTGRPNKERLGHLANSLDGLRVAFLSHFFTFSWRQPIVEGQIFAMKEIRLLNSTGWAKPSRTDVNRSVCQPPRCIGLRFGCSENTEGLRL